MQTLIVTLALLQLCSAFYLPRTNSFVHRRPFFSSVEDDKSSPAESEDPTAEAVVEEMRSIPTYLPSAKGIDYVPLATMLATGDFLGADQFTRDNLIKIGSKEGSGRPFVYWTEVKDIPSVDLATMERLWLEFSDGKFGYSVQKRIYDVEKGDFDRVIKRIGWTKVDGDLERKLRWFGDNEFMYTMDAPQGHLPLTSALRGTQLFTKLMEHPVWNEYDWKKYKELTWEP
mmetsp:Transcript_12904/g.21610  ORF Transcript_12904/g.21610 Transcript_12904/m.21610 type:complete len:229 (+) Transcript_12904:50-736(+)